MTAVTTTIRRASLAALAVLAAAVPAAHADRPQYPQDDDIWATSVAAGQTEHGLWTAGNINDPHDSLLRRNEYCGDRPDRWYETVTDAPGTSWRDRSAGTRERHRSSRRWASGRGRATTACTSRRSFTRLIPSSAVPELTTYNGELIASRVFVALSPPQQRTIAAFADTVYELNFGGPNKHTVETVVLQDGTFQPLMREDKIAHPGGGGPALDFQTGCARARRCRRRRRPCSSPCDLRADHEPWRARSRRPRRRRPRPRRTTMRRSRGRRVTSASPGSCPCGAHTSDARSCPAWSGLESLRGALAVAVPGAAPARDGEVGDVCASRVVLVESPGPRGDRHRPPRRPPVRAQRSRPRAVVAGRDDLRHARLAAAGRDLCARDR